VTPEMRASTACCTVSLYISHLVSHSFEILLLISIVHLHCKIRLELASAERERERKREKFKRSIRIAKVSDCGTRYVARFNRRNADTPGCSGSCCVTVFYRRENSFSRARYSMNEDGDVNLSARHLCSSIIPRAVTANYRIHSLSLSLSLVAWRAACCTRVVP